MKKQFRVYHLDEKSYGTPIPNKNGDPWNPIDYEFDGGRANLEFALQVPEKFIVEQWTGLEDRNGEKIFEGDILKHGPGTLYEQNCVIRFGEYTDGEGFGALGFYGRFVLDVPQVDLESGFGLSRKSVEKDEIVGNVNENSQLLECQKKTE